ncbi:glycosyltransferase family 1 protein [Clostridium sardiniense]|uniref:glycosyltransferase family 1 protein n=1 Tax=Clostridium sardiniense TaxID=29369 RepID=UPI003D329217
MKKKVLHIVGGMDIGGTETMLMNLYRTVNTRIQFDFISYYEKEGYYDKEIRELGGQVISIDSSSKVGMIKSIKNLCKVIKENGPYDAVHAHTLFNCGVAMIAAKVSGVNIRVSHAHTNLDSSSNIIKKIYMWCMRKTINLFSTDCIACSESAGKYLFGEDIFSSEKYRLLPNYVDYKKYLNCHDTDGIREELGIKHDDIVIGHVGRFVDAKNHKFLIEIIDEMIKVNKRVKAILVGDGELKEKIENYAKELGIRDSIYFLGIREDIDRILNNLDVFIFPSIYEGLGLVMIEAQSSGIPCLVSEAIQKEADLEIGLVKQIKLSDKKELWVKEAFELIKSKNKNEELILDAIKNKGYDLDNIVKTLLKIYKLDLELRDIYELGDIYEKDTDIIF